MNNKDKIRRNPEKENTENQDIKGGALKLIQEIVL